MARRQVATARTAQERSQRELADLQLVLRARNGDSAAMDALIRRYTGFVRLKASSYFLAGGESDDLNQEGLIGLYKAVRDFRADKETSFRSFAEPASPARSSPPSRPRPASSTRRSTRTSPSARRPPARTTASARLGDALPGPGVDDPAVCVISTQELQSLVFCLGTGLSPLESDALRYYLEGNSYEEMADLLGCDTKTIDNALQRVKRKVLSTRAAASSPRLTPATIAQRAGVAQLVEQPPCKR